MPSLDDYSRQRLDHLESRSLRRQLTPTNRLPGGRAERGGKVLVELCSNDYLGLSHDPELARVAAAAAAEHGVGAGASRLVTGDHPVLHQLEAGLAALKGTADAVVFGSGYLANLGVIPCFAARGDLVLLDELAHACLHAGARSGGATVRTFRHSDVDHLDALLTEHRGGHPRCVVATDGVFSMDGDLAPIPALAEVAERHDAWLLTDDAHGVGVVGGGRGSTVATGAIGRVPLQTGTLSKALGAYGGYLCASTAACDLVRTRARSLIYTTALPPAVAATALAALERVTTDPHLVARPHALARRLCAHLGLPEPDAAIVPIVIGDAEAALVASAALEAEGFLVTAIRPPTVPEGTARLRITLSAAHTEADIDALAAALLRLDLIR